MDKYTLPSGKASIEGRVDGFGDYEVRIPIKRKDLESCLREALKELAKIKCNKLIVKEVE